MSSGLLEAFVTPQNVRHVDFKLRQCSTLLGIVMELVQFGKILSRIANIYTFSFDGSGSMVNEELE